MKFLVLGAGRMGYAVAYDLIRSPRVEQVILADKDLSRLDYVRGRLGDGKITPVELDVENEKETIDLMTRCSVAIGCVGDSFNYELAKCALKAKSHFVDLGGDSETVAKQMLLDELAREQGVTMLPELGLAPGLVSILAVSAAESLDELYEIRLRAGGVPVEPDNALKYGQEFSIDGLINEYSENVTVIRDGKQMLLPALTDVETVEFAKPFGTMEAFNASCGGAGLVDAYGAKVRHLDYKAIRYPGHCSQMALLKELGLMSSEPISLSSGRKVKPREVLARLLEQHLPKDEPDAVLMRVTVTGTKNRQPVQLVWQCIDYNDQAQGLSAMMRMTAFPASIIAQMIARGDIQQHGVLRQEQTVPTKLLLAELASRGIDLTMAEHAPVPQSK